MKTSDFNKRFGWQDQYSKLHYLKHNVQREKDGFSLGCEEI